VKLSFAIATETDAGAIARLRNAAAGRLTRDFGPGHWSGETSEAGVLQVLKNSRTYVARTRSAIVGTLRLATRKPWAIDPRYFAQVKKPLYLVDMAVAPGHQRKGVGRLLLAHALDAARAWAAEAIRLDAYDAAAGAGPFYAKCGYREVGRVNYRGTPLIYYELLL
jgi:GNAT superfamily N-acetyltransferase